jgi:hypothetical protein
VIKHQFIAGVCGLLSALLNFPLAQALHEKLTRSYHLLRAKSVFEKI